MLSVTGFSCDLKRKGILFSITTHAVNNGWHIVSSICLCYIEDKTKYLLPQQYGFEVLNSAVLM